jgi:Spy/CpxP family protein refolding chaperone
MKKQRFLAILIITAASAWGQQPPPSGPGDLDAGHPGRGPGKPPRDLMHKNLFPAGLVMRNQDAIGLSQEQKRGIREEMEKNMPQFSELQKQQHAAEESLSALLKEQKPDEAKVLSQFDKLLEVEAQIKRMQIALQLKIKSLLSPDQQAKLQELKKQDRPPRPSREKREKSDESGT